MITNWHLSSTPAQYSSDRYNYFLKVETQNHATPDYQVYLDSRNYLSIGVGFNLTEPSVRTQVFREFGLIQDNPLLSASARLVENNYIQQLTTAITGQQLVQLNTIMGQRATNTALAVLGTRRPRFEFSNDYGTTRDQGHEMSSTALFPPTKPWWTDGWQAFRLPKNAPRWFRSPTTARLIQLPVFLRRSVPNSKPRFRTMIARKRGMKSVMTPTRVP